MQYFIDSKYGILQAAQNCGDKKPFLRLLARRNFTNLRNNCRITKNFFTASDQFVIVRQRCSKTASSEPYACLKKANSVLRCFLSAFI